MFARELGYVVAKRAAAPAGSTVVLDVTGPTAVHAAVEVGADRRGRPLPEDPAEPTVTLRMDPETYVVLAGGRRRPEDVDVEVHGDEQLRTACSSRWPSPRERPLGPPRHPRPDGPTCLVTGVTSGLGKAVAARSPRRARKW